MRLLKQQLVFADDNDFSLAIIDIVIEIRIVRKRDLRSDNTIPLACSEIHDEGLPRIDPIAGNPITGPLPVLFGSKMPNWNRRAIGNFKLPTIPSINTWH